MNEAIIIIGKGKTTLVKTLLNNFDKEQISCYTLKHIIKNRFGLNDIYNKKINVSNEEEFNIKMFRNNKWKSLIHSEKQFIDIRYKEPITENINCNFIFIYDKLPDNINTKEINRLGIKIFNLNIV